MQRVSQSTGLQLAELGSRIRGERQKRGLSLEELASRARVSRSMLSAVERGDKAPSILILDQIATGLGSSIARLLAEEEQGRVILLRAGQQDVAVDASGWERRILSPVLHGVEFEFMRTTLSPGVNAGAFLPHNAGSREYVAVESGTLRLTLDSTVYLLKKGDSIYYAGDCVHEFENPDRRVRCEYYLAMDVTGHPDQLRHRLAIGGPRTRRSETL
ncbi:MAG TPA: XRE family transcriptional regulator [Bryobacteraceae bacterium]|nr:XRE family transcriptional regulator [Bryobacteraceae bacterium]